MASSSGLQDAEAQVLGSPGKRGVEGVGLADLAGPVGVGREGHGVDAEEHRPKRSKTEAPPPAQETKSERREKLPGVAMIKEEYLIHDAERQGADRRSGRDEHDEGDEIDDDAAEGQGRTTNDRGGGGGGGKKKHKNKGQNKDRDFGRSHDAIRLCVSVAHSPEFSPKPCQHGERCRSSHDLRGYLKDGRRADLNIEVWAGQCPVFATYGRCASGWRCRFVASHMREVEHTDGRKELVLVTKEGDGGDGGAGSDGGAGDGAGSSSGGGDAHTATDVPMDDDARPGVVNVVPTVEKYNLTRRRTVLHRSEEYIKWLNSELDVIKKIYHSKERGVDDKGEEGGENDGKGKDKDRSDVEDARAQFVDPPFLPSEKRRIYFGPETPTLAPLTTQGNLPFRRLCVELGCQVTYSEMALGLDMLTGKQGEWALMKAHASEVTPPQFRPGAAAVQSFYDGLDGLDGYDNSRDLKFGAQIAANQPWMAIKATEAMTRLLPHLRVVDVNCGCPIELVCRNGGGSGLLEAHNKLERMVRGMNAVSGEVPITAKLRMGVRDQLPPIAHKVMERLAFGGADTRARLGAPGCAAITLHGRTRNQRYKKPADWSYIAECAALVRAFRDQRDRLADTVREPDPRSLAAGSPRMFFLGNGDCYSHEHYYDHIAHAGVDSVMIGRGALVKPWLFQEIAAGQYLDKSASERLAYVEKFARYGMEAWGTDELGLGTTRRFLLEYLSFASRYVPIGLLQHLPPSLSDRPPAYRSRNDLEALLASPNYKDWIKISEMFLGPAHPDFKFVPKHKSNSYEIEAEG